MSGSDPQPGSTGSGPTGEVVVLGGAPDDLDELARSIDVDLRAADDVAAAPLRRGRTLVVVAPAAAGPDTARLVHARVPGTPVLFVAGDGAEHEQLAATLRITPGISRRTAVVHPGEELVRAVAAEVDRSRRQGEHLATVRAVSQELAELTDATPETLNAYLGQLFDHAPIGILIADASGALRAANPGARRLLGGPAGRITLGRPFAECFGDGAQHAADLLVDTSTTGEVAVDTLVRGDGRGGRQHLELTVAPVDPSSPSSGTVVLVRDESDRVAAAEAADSARRAAEADRRAAEEAAERMASIAATLQESLLPPSLPVIEGAELASWFRPAGDGSEIGGDFYDVYQRGAGDWSAVIGDVCGKGVQAARLTALTRYTLRAVAARSRSCGTDLSELNEALLRQDPAAGERDRRFVTAAVLRFDRADGGLDIEVASGGHPPALVLRAEGTVEEVPTRGPLLGVFDDVSFRTAELHLEPGDVVLVYTDGVTEARRDTDGELFGEQRLADVLAGAAGGGAAAAVDAVRTAVMAHQSGHTSDDVAVLAVRAASS